MNAYTLATFSVHEKVYGEGVGKHPLITQMLKGVLIKDLQGQSITVFRMLTDTWTIRSLAVSEA